MKNKKTKIYVIDFNKQKIFYETILIKRTLKGQPKPIQMKNKLMKVFHLPRFYKLNISYYESIEKNLRGANT